MYELEKKESRGRAREGEAEISRDKVGFAKDASARAEDSVGALYARACMRYLSRARRAQRIVFSLFVGAR